jgi:hypothetical protein
MSTRFFQNEKEAPLVPTGAEKKQRDQERSMRAYQRWYREQYRAQLIGPNAIGWRELSRILRKLTMDNEQALVDYVSSSAWLRHADSDTRHLALALISKAMARVNVRNGYPPFNDALWDQAPGAYLIIRGVLTFPKKLD